MKTIGDTRKCRMSGLGPLVFLGCLIVVLSPQISNGVIIPADRLPLPGTWESAGVEGGIPNRQTICADVTQSPYNANNTGSADASQAIQSAINDCPADRVVYIPAGTYRIDQTITIDKSSITLRGAGPTTVFQAAGPVAIQLGRVGPWPTPKMDSTYRMRVTGTLRGNKTVNVSNTSAIEVGKMIMIDEVDDPSFVWATYNNVGRHRASMHLVESKTGTSVTFRPPLQTDFTISQELSWWPDLVRYSGVENIKFVGSGSTNPESSTPSNFIDIYGAWNIWVTGCEFTAMPKKMIVVTWSGHVEIRKNYAHDQSNGQSNSEGFDFLTDVSWSLIVDNICVAAGFPQINIGDGGSSADYSGGVGNVIAYNYCVNSFFTDPPTSVDHGILTADISTNHSPHNQFNLIEGNIVGKFGSDAYYGSGSHTALLRNIATARNRWVNAAPRIAVSIDARNLYYNLVGNVLGEVGNPTAYEYFNTPQQPSSASTIYRLGFPHSWESSLPSTTLPPTALNPDPNGSSPRDLYVDRNTTTYGTTIIEGNWNSKLGRQDWTITPELIPNSYFLTSKPNWFGSLNWPPVDPANPVTDDPTIIPAGYRYVHGMDPPGIGSSVYHPADTSPADNQINITELTSYAGCWKTGCAPSSGPNPIPISYVTRAGAIWKGTGNYRYEQTKSCPACWVVTP